MSYSKTTNGGVQFDHSQNHALEFFSKAGSQFTNSSGSGALNLFKNVWFTGDHNLAMRLLFWLRDPRGGAGNRSGYRECLRWVSETDPKWIIANMHLIPEHGRWDDVRSTFGTEAEDSATDLWASKISEKDFLASKWASRKDKQILRKLRKSKAVKDIGEFRRLLAEARNSVPEVAMCQDEWKALDYSKIPSVAMARYTKAFGKHDAERFEAYKAALVSDAPEDAKVKVNASVLFPHDVIRTLRGGDKAIADAQFEALPNYMEKNNMRVMPIVDTSGSMGCTVAGSIQAVDVSTSLGLYCSDRVGKDNPFYRKFLQFNGEATLTDWSMHNKLSQAMHLFNGAVANTNIQKALDTVLKYAKMFNATDEQIPNCLLIISDMQFDAGGCMSGGGWGGGNKYGSTDVTEVNQALNRWEEAGYSRPKIVYWNTKGSAGSPERVNSKDIGLVSGFSPAILQAVFGNEDFSPLGIMMKAIEKYQITQPE